MVLSKCYPIGAQDHSDKKKEAEAAKIPEAANSSFSYKEKNSNKDISGGRDKKRVKQIN